MAREAEENWARQFQKQQAPDQLPECDVPISQVGLGGTAAGVSDLIAIEIDKVLVACRLSPSRTEAQRKIKERAVHVENELVEDRILRRSLPNPFVLRLGKRMLRVYLRAG